MGQRGVTVNGESIKHLRAQQGLTQATLAERAGIDQATVSRAEGGRCDLYSRDRLAEALGVKPVDLMGLTPERQRLIKMCLPFYEWKGVYYWRERMHHDPDWYFDEVLAPALHLDWGNLNYQQRTTWFLMCSTLAADFENTYENLAKKAVELLHDSDRIDIGLDITRVEEFNKYALVQNYYQTLAQATGTNTDNDRCIDFIKINNPEGVIHGKENKLLQVYYRDYSPYRAITRSLATKLNSKFERNKRMLRYQVWQLNNLPSHLQENIDRFSARSKRAELPALGTFIQV